MRTDSTLSSTTRPRWYLIQCKTREETRALENLERQGFACYLPMLTLERVRLGRKAAVREPLFPGYVFIQLDEVNDNWRPIRSTRGVIGIVRFDECPLPVEDELIESIRDRLASKPAVPYLRRGDPVFITGGCFSSLRAVFLANDGEARVLLLMDILGREQALSFPVSRVRRCDAREGHHK